jgi:hypothetical protein
MNTNYGYKGKWNDTKFTFSIVLLDETMTFICHQYGET